MIATTAKSATARRNGARSHGPTTAAGKARSAQNARSHGVCARTLVLSDANESAMLAELRAVLLARWQPFDAAEANLVEELVFAAWRQLRLRLVEDAVLARAQRGEPASPDLPSLTTLIRYRGRLDQDAWRASQALLELRRGREEIADPMRLRWLAERIDQALAIAAAYPAPTVAAGTSGPTETGDTAGAPLDGEPGMNEPTGAETGDAVSEPQDGESGMNEPSRPPTTLPAPAADAPTRPVTSLNRHRRRRRAALARRGLAMAA